MTNWDHQCASLQLPARWSSKEPAWLKAKRSDQKSGKGAVKPLKQQTISFLDLPGEIRNQIYSYCLIAHDTPANPRPNVIVGNSNRMSDHRTGREWWKPRSKKPWTFVERFPALNVDGEDKSVEVEEEKKPEAWGEGPEYMHHIFDPCDPAVHRLFLVEVQRAKLVPALLQLNKQIHQEAASVLYNQDFCFANRFGYDDFMKHCGQTPFLYMKRLTIGHAGFRFGRVGVRGEMPRYIASLIANGGAKLEQLNIEFAFGQCYRPEWWRLYDDESMVHHANSLALKVFKDLKGWFITVARAKGNKLAGCMILDIGEEHWSSERPEISARIAAFREAYWAELEGLVWSGIKAKDMRRPAFLRIGYCKEELKECY